MFHPTVMTCDRTYRYNHFLGQHEKKLPESWHALIIDSRYYFYIVYYMINVQIDYHYET